MKNFLIGLCVTGLMVGCFGCNNPSSQQPAKSAAQPEMPSPAKIADDTEVTNRLQAASAKLNRNDQGNISDIDLRGIVVKDELLLGLSRLPALQSLALDTAELTHDGWNQIGSATTLRQLDLRECSLSNEELAMAVGPLSGLRVLRLASKSGATTVDDTGLDAVAKCTQLRVLALDYLWVANAGLTKLAALNSLTELYLANTLVDDQSIDVLVKLSQLKKLRLARTQIGDTGLARVPEFKLLEDLDLSECSQITDAGLAALGKIVTLKRLNLWRDAISDDGVKQLVKLTNMEWLNVDNTQLTDGGLDAFQGMTKLTFLHLGSTGVSDAGMPKLKPLRALKDLKVTRTSVTQHGVDELLKDLPAATIQLKYSESE